MIRARCPKCGILVDHYGEERRCPRCGAATVAEDAGRADTKAAASCSALPSLQRRRATQDRRLPHSITGEERDVNGWGFAAVLMICVTAYAITGLILSALTARDIAD